MTAPNEAYVYMELPPFYIGDTFLAMNHLDVHLYPFSGCRTK